MAAADGIAAAATPTSSPLAVFVAAARYVVDILEGGGCLQVPDDGSSGPAAVRA